MFQAAGDDLALYIAYSALAEVAEMRAQMDAALEAYERAFAYARQAGHVPAGVLAARAGCRFFGTTPVSELLAWLDENEPRAGRDHWLRAYRAGALAMLGRFDEARAILAETRAELAERGGGVLLANITAFESVWSRALGRRSRRRSRVRSRRVQAARGAGGTELPVDRGRRTWRRRSTRSTGSTRPTPGPAAPRSSARATTSGTQMLWRQVRAKVLARRGQHAEAERLAREAVAVGEETDMLDAQGDAYADLAEVLLLGGNADEAAAALEQALERYKRKENHVSAHRAQERLAELQNAAPR